MRTAKAVRLALLAVCALFVTVVLWLARSSETTRELDTRKAHTDFENTGLQAIHKADLPTPKGRVGDNTVDWIGGQIPETTLQRHITGWTILDNLYSLNGTFYIVTDDPSAFPPLRDMISSGYPMKNGKVEIAKQEPTEEDMTILSTSEASVIFGEAASRVTGASFICNDPKQFVAHYYHFTAEIFLGLWRTYASLDPYISATGDTDLPPPSRIIFPHLPQGGWRDQAGLNHIILRGAFPSLAFEYTEDWQERASTNRPFVFDRVVLTARTTSHRAKGFSIDDKMTAIANKIPASPNWWLPVRRNVLKFAGASSESILADPKPVITYISRQGRGRSLVQEDHDGLVEALKGLETRYGWEVNIAIMEKYSKLEQLRLAARTTILIGVHGNGLTSLLWMQPSPSATVIEIFFPGGFSVDYQVTANVTGIEHYGFWGDRYFRSNTADKPERHQPKGFHENHIPVDGLTVAALCVERINSPHELSSNMKGEGQS